MDKASAYGAGVIVSKHFFLQVPPSFTADLTRERQTFRLDLSSAPSWELSREALSDCHVSQKTTVLMMVSSFVLEREK